MPAALLDRAEEDHGEVDEDGEIETHPTGAPPQPPPKKASWLLVALLFWCGVGTFARTEVFVLQTRYFSLCAGYGKVSACHAAHVRKNAHDVDLAAVCMDSSRASALVTDVLLFLASQRASASHPTEPRQ